MARAQRVDVANDEKFLIINYLNKARNSPFSLGNTPVSVQNLAQDLEMTQEHVHRLCRQLALGGTLKEIEVGGKYPYYRL